MSVEHSRPSVGTTATIVARAIGTTEQVSVQNPSAVSVFLGGSFPVTQTVYADTPALGSIDVALSHHLTEFADLTPPASEGVSSIFQARIFRDSANAGDTATVTAAMLFLDCHVEMDRLGSRDEFTQ